MNLPLLFFIATISQANLSPSLSGPVDIYYTDDGHFRIFYTLAGEDAVSSVDEDPQNGVSDYIDKIAEGAKFAWQKIVNEYGWRSPGMVDIYVQKLGQGGSSSGNSIFISNNLLLPTESEIGSLVAHEFMHTVENAYDEESPWWEEAVAEWMSHYLYGLFDENIMFFSLQLNLMDRLGKNYMSLYDYRMAYVNSLWVWFLQKWAGEGDQTIVRRMWERAGDVSGENTLESIDYVLKQNCSDLLTAFQEFTVWNYFLGPNDDEKHYPNGKQISTSYGSVKIDNHHDTYPVSAGSITPPYPLGANYLEIIPDVNFAGAEMEFSGEAEVIWGMSVIFLMQDGGSKAEHKRADENGFLYTIFNDWARYKRIIIVLQNLNTTGETPATYSYEIRGGDFHEEEGCGCSSNSSQKNSSLLPLMIISFIIPFLYRSIRF